MTEAGSGFGRIPGPGEWFTAFENEDFVILSKGAGIPSAPLKNGKESLYEKALEIYPEIACVDGMKAGEGGLLHRLDNDTSGLVLIARNNCFFNMIAENRRCGSLCKEYTAYSVKADGTLPAVKSITSRFRAFGPHGAAVRPVFEDSGMADRKKAGSSYYSTEIAEAYEIPVLEAGSRRDGCRHLIRIQCRIKEGFRHQVRSHLAWTGFSVYGDPLYGEGLNGAAGKKMQRMLFFASGLTFIYRGEEFSFRIPQDLLDAAAIYEFRKDFEDR